MSGAAACGQPIRHFAEVGVQSRWTDDDQDSRRRGKRAEGVADTARDEQEGSLAHLGLLVASDEAVATLEHQESFAMVAMDVWDGSTQDRPRLLDQLEGAACLGRAGDDQPLGKAHPPISC